MVKIEKTTKEKILENYIIKRLILASEILLACGVIVKFISFAFDEQAIYHFIGLATAKDVSHLETRYVSDTNHIQSIDDKLDELILRSKYTSFSVIALSGKFSSAELYDISSSLKPKSNESKTDSVLGEIVSDFVLNGKVKSK